MLVMANLLHLINPTMTFDATYTTIHMDRMIKVDIFGSLVNAYPRNRKTLGYLTVTILVLVFPKFSILVRILTKIAVADAGELGITDLWQVMQTFADGTPA